MKEIGSGLESGVVVELGEGVRLMITSDYCKVQVKATDRIRIIGRVRDIFRVGVSERVIAKLKQGHH